MALSKIFCRASVGHGESGGVLHHLLVAALDGAVTVEEVDHIAVVVRQDLDLHVLGALQVFLDEDLVVAEGFLDSSMAP